MQRVKALINKLQEQLDQGSDASAMMVTVQLLQVELQHAAQDSRPQFGSAKVAVVLPSFNSSYTKVSTHGIINNGMDENKKNGTEIIPESAPKEPVVLITKEIQEEPETIELVQKENDSSIEWVFDSIREIPTLANHQNVKEVNEIMAQNGSSSLNDRLRKARTEVADVIIDSPVRDLRKAIGINDRFVFLNDLFRGDEVMYERSIKTINNFRILAEAQFWIERELKLKLGWDESKDIVKHFDQLVKRRFS